MIIIRIAGGLGNQMQQYAMYRLFLEQGKEAKLDLSWFSKENQKTQLAPRAFELAQFCELPYRTCSDEERDLFLRRGIGTRLWNKLFPGTCRIFEETKMYHPELLQLEEGYLNGYFLNNLYYADIWPLLQKTFVFPPHTKPTEEEKNQRLMETMRQTDSVSLHIRRGDYLDKENAAIFGGITTDAYYAAAIDYFTEQFSDTHFYIFTNDTDYARERYTDTERFTIIDWNTGENSLLDMQLMSCCRGNICANSTFSFWGARLNTRADQTVIRPYRMRNNQSYDVQQMHHYWGDWILMDETGQIV